MCAARREPAQPAPPSDIARRREERRNATGRRSDSRWTQILAAATTVFSRLGYWTHRWFDPAGRLGLDEVARGFITMALDGLATRPDFRQPCSGIR
jgi:Tetracyclin repressor-like, C-terminal domain